MKRFSLWMLSTLFLFLGFGCHTHTHTKEVYHEPAPQAEPQPVKKIYQEPVREEIIEERTTTRVVDEYQVIEGNQKRPADRSYEEDEDSTERVVEEHIVVE